MILGSSGAAPHTGTMKCNCSIRLMDALCLAVLAGNFGLSAQTIRDDPGWPRHYTNGIADLALYQPQVDAWNGFQTLTGRCALAITPGKGRSPVYGTFRFSA